MIQQTVGSNDDQGAVYVYTQPAGGWATTSADSGELTATDGTGGDELGYSVAISDNTIVGGSPRHVQGSSTADHGAAYVFGPGSIVVPPPPVVVPPTTKVRSISGGHAEITVALSCPAGGATCAPVSLKATVKEHLKGRKITAITAGVKHKKVRTTTKQVAVASARLTLSAGREETLTLKLNSTGRALLSKFGKLRAIVTMSSGGKTIKTVTVTVLKAKKPKKKR
jgi:FG-GAP repeat